ncbi:unnamed protein product [Brassica oleracea]
MMATIIIDYQNCFIFIFLCFFSLLCYTLFFRKQKNFPLPPSPPSLPIIGHLDLLLSVLAHRSLQKLSSKAHDVNISSRGLPPTEDSLFAGSFSFISAPYGDYWKFMKKVLVTNLLLARTSGSQAVTKSPCRRARSVLR